MTLNKDYYGLITQNILNKIAVLMTKFLFLYRKYLNSIVLMAIWGMKHLVLLTVIILLKILKLLKKTTQCYFLLCM